MYTRKLSLQFLLLVLMAVCLLGQSYAQQTTGSIRGVVTDSSGAALASAPVIVTNTATGAVHNAVTTGDGSYSVVDLPDGVYQVEVKVANFKSSITKNVVVHVATDTTVNAQLQLGTVAEQVTVEASAVQVQT